MDKTEFKLKPGQRFVVVDGAHIPFNEKNETVWFIVLDEPAPVIDPDYVNQVFSLGRKSEGYKGSYFPELTGTTHSFYFYTEVFRFSSKVSINVVMAPIEKVIEEHQDYEFVIKVIDGAFIEDNWDNDFFKVYVNLIKYDFQ